MRLFKLDRTKDVNGNSGVGLVAEGIQFSSGRVVLTWLSPLSSIAVYDSIQDVVRIHCRRGHETDIVWEIESEFVPIARARCERCGNDVEDAQNFVRHKGDYYHVKCWASQRRDRLQQIKRENGTHDPQHSVTKRELWEYETAEATES